MTQSIHGEAAAQMNQLHDELLLASRVQREFLPKALPTGCGIEAAVLFRPAGFVSGDIYDVSRLDENHIGFFLADAMGHGVPAALMTIFIGACLPQKEIIGNSYQLVPPGEALARLNRYLFASRGGPTRFATAVCGQIDTRTGLVTVASAGHPAALRISASGVTASQAVGTLLGALPDAEYVQESFELAVGDVLLVHSDGVESAFPSPAPETAGPGPQVLPGHAARLAGPTKYLERLAAVREGGAAGEVAGHLDRLAEDLDRQRGSMHQLDDVTVIAFERTPRGFGADRRRHGRVAGSVFSRR
jgi:serine phosphatase RsbU (regulator of sigma subunit)